MANEKADVATAKWARAYEVVSGAGALVCEVRSAVVDSGKMSASETLVLEAENAVVSAGGQAAGVGKLRRAGKQ